ALGGPSEDPNPGTRALIRARIGEAAQASKLGGRALLLIGDSVLAGDVMDREVNAWQEQRVVDHLRRELAPDSNAFFSLVALDGLLPIDGDFGVGIECH
ncbi:MAG: hypothetical protein MJK04_31615, partial [Psychrosphaera sp.]|nr:hypothetical protein [Psychrosphaera sp.]